MANTKKKKPARTQRAAGQYSSPKKRPRKRELTATPERAVPPPLEELEPEPRAVPPGSITGSSGSVTQYPNRSDWESEISTRARRQIHEGKRPRRTKGPTTEAS